MTNFLQRAKRFVSLWPDLWAIPLSFIGFAISYYVLWIIDPTSGVFDLGYLQALFLTAIALVVINVLAFLGIQFNWKFLWKDYKDGGMENDWIKISPWQRLLVTLSVYFCYFLLAVVILTGLI